METAIEAFAGGDLPPILRRLSDALDACRGTQPALPLLRSRVPSVWMRLNAGAAFEKFSTRRIACRLSRLAAASQLLRQRCVPIAVVAHQAVVYIVTPIPEPAMPLFPPPPTSPFFHG